MEIRPVRRDEAAGLRELRLRALGDAPHAGSGYNTIPADRRPTWALAVMNRGRAEARLGGRDDGPDGEPGGRAACPARHPANAPEVVGRRTHNR
jgi:hypothetical protein